MLKGHRKWDASILAEHCSAVATALLRKSNWLPGFCQCQTLTLIESRTWNGACVCACCCCPSYHLCDPEGFCFYSCCGCGCDGGSCMQARQSDNGSLVW
jgi:hypothetical protein